MSIDRFNLPALNIDKLKTIINNKLEFDINIPLSEKTDKNKNEIATQIISTIQLLPVSAAQINRVANDQRIKFICTTETQIKLMTNTTSSAIFTPAQSNNSAIYFTANQLTSSLINHEFRHADSFLRHADNENIIHATLPIVATQENIINYCKALELGDERIRHFKSLWTKKKLKQLLSADENTILCAYEKSSQQCLPPLLLDIYDISMLDKLKSLNIKQGSVLQKGIEEMKILNIEIKNNQVHIFMQPTDSAMYIFQILQDVVVKLSSENYVNKSTLEKLIERDAYTFQCLSGEAINIFYPEAQALIDKDIQLSYKKTTLPADSVGISKKNIYHEMNPHYQNLILLAQSDNDILPAIKAHNFSLALKKAVVKCQLEVIKNILIYVKTYPNTIFNINEPFSNGNTALDWANGIKDEIMRDTVIQLLVENGAKSKNEIPYKLYT